MKLKPNVNDWEKHRVFPLEIYYRIANSGLFSMIYQKSILENNPSYVSIMTYELAKTGSQAISVAFTAFFAVLYGLNKHAKCSSIDSAIDGILSGKNILALAITEPSAGSYLKNINTTINFNHSDDSITLNGRKTFICNADYATHILVAAKNNGKMQLVLIEKTEAVKTERISILGWHALNVSEITFDNVIIQKYQLIGEADDSSRILFDMLNRERLNLAVIACATSKLAYEKAVQHTKKRVTFGKNLIKHQSIKHKLANMLIKIKVCENFVCKVIKDIKEENLSIIDIAIAKNNSVECCNYVTNSTLQILGGYGCIQNSLVETAYRDSRILNIGGGTDEMMLEVIAANIEKSIKTP